MEAGKLNALILRMLARAGLGKLVYDEEGDVADLSLELEIPLTLTVAKADLTTAPKQDD